MDKTSSISIHEGKPIRCKAALCKKAGEALVIEEIQVDPPQAYEVRIKILCTSLCHTDVTFWKLDWGPLARFPKILGHEAVGVVESIGDHVNGFKQGDVVLPVFHPHCEECRDCKSPKSNWCSRYCDDFFSNTRRYGMDSRFKDSSGEDIYHFLFVSSFTEYTVVDIAHLVKISPEIPVEKAALLSCCVSSGVGAAWKVADVEEGSTVAIFGLGGVGLAVAEGARVRGAAKIIGVDLNPDKFEIVGKRFGITDFVNPALSGEKKISQVIKEMTEGGVDYSFECIGITSLMEEAFNSTRTGSGKTVILGMEKQMLPISLGSHDLLRGRTICGTLFGGLKPKVDIPILVDSYLKRELNLNGFITHELSFEEINKAFDLLVKGETIRCFSSVVVLSPPEHSLSLLRSSSLSGPMAKAASAQTPSLSEQYHLENEVKQVKESPEESNDEVADEITLETAPADFRFPTTNQTRHCFTRYIEYHRCVAAKGDDAPECDKFAKFYRSLCPSEWVDRWNEQRENGTFPGPL
ncbi:unnamed protein product [Brassica rapa]|uniref:alcohol dehydrogenase n=1 Tax=Brassica campestris TaxID=3711 RepID=A0A8D9M6L1_BRACM|nr:unnamed protein product [Brassica rapa]